MTTLYLLDTNIISVVALTKRRTESDALLDAWMEAHGDDLRLSVVTAAEVRAGILHARRSGATKKAEALAEWWEAVLHFWSARILPFDLAVAEETGRLLDIGRAAGTTPGFEDVAIAATASAHRLTVLTRNARHFRPLGVRFIDPTEHLPSDASPTSQR